MCHMSGSPRVLCPTKCTPCVQLDYRSESKRSSTYIRTTARIKHYSIKRSGLVFYKPQTNRVTLLLSAGCLLVRPATPKPLLRKGYLAFIWQYGSTLTSKPAMPSRNGYGRNRFGQEFVEKHYFSIEVYGIRHCAEPHRFTTRDPACCSQLIHLTYSCHF